MEQPEPHRTESPRSAQWPRLTRGNHLNRPAARPSLRPKQREGRQRAVVWQPWLAVVGNTRHEPTTWA
jgi:hypothetical protein